MVDEPEPVGELSLLNTITAQNDLDLNGWASIGVAMATTTHAPPAAMLGAPVANLLVPMDAGGRADAVSEQLARAIQLGLFGVGEQLPAESVLAAQLGVSTVTLREALSSLRRQGLVETRRGRNGGTFVLGPSSAATNRARTRLREISVVELRDLADEWTAVAGASARLAARRASAAELGQLRGFAADLAGAGRAGDRIRAYSRFSIELALASQSERLTRAEVRLQGEAGQMLWLPIGEPLDPVAVAGDLQAIADAVAAEDEHLARDLAEQSTQRNTRWLINAHLELT